MVRCVIARRLMRRRKAWMRWLWAQAGRSSARSILTASSTCSRNPSSWIQRTCWIPRGCELWGLNTWASGGDERPVNQEILNPAKQFARQSERLTSLSQTSLPQPSLSQVSIFVSGILDSLSYFFFCLSFSSLTHLLGSWWNRFLAEE